MILKVLVSFFFFFFKVFKIIENRYLRTYISTTKTSRWRVKSYSVLEFTVKRDRQGSEPCNRHQQVEYVTGN